MFRILSALALVNAAMAGHAQTVGQTQTSGQIQPFTYGIDLGMGETDNVTLAHSNPQSQTLAIADADFALKDRTRTLDLAATGNFSYLDFVQGAYSPELIGRFDGSGKASLVPDVLSWTVEDNFGQAQIDPFTPQTPTNRENINYFTTGPNLDLRFGSEGFADFSARYARSSYQISPFNSNRFDATAAFGERLSGQSSVSLHVTSERALFANTILNSDLTRSSVFADYSMNGARTEASINVGVTHTVQGAFSENGPLVRIDLSRQVSPSAKVSLEAGRIVTDGSTGFSALQAGASGSIATANASFAQSTQNYTASYGQLAYTFIRERTTFRVSALWERDAYPLLSQLNVIRGDGEVYVERKLTPNFTARLNAVYLRNEYPQTNYTDNDILGGAVLSYQPGRALEFKLRFEHWSHEVSGFNTGTGYGENRVFLTVGFRPRHPSARGSKE